MKRIFAIISSAVIMCGCGGASEPAAELDIASMLPSPFEKANIISYDDYNNWGTNIVKGKDGKYHAIYSRWERSKGHLAWVTDSEVAHAVSDNLTGPYVYQNMVLPPRGREFWDGDVTHNPHLLEYDGKYYLYYMGNRGSGYWETVPEGTKPNYKDDEWWVNRNNQQVGVAVTDDLNGEWTRFDKPLIGVEGTDRMMTSTPTVSIREDGKFLMAYKYVVPDERYPNGRVVHVTALSDSPLGPFVDTGKPFITHPTASFAIDDHVEWFQDGRYYCIAKDSRGVMTDHGEGATLLFVSDAEGMDWKLAENELVLAPGTLNWDDGTQTLCDRTADMPKLYFEDGKLTALIIATLPKGEDDSFVTVLPLEYK